MSLSIQGFYTAIVEEKDIFDPSSWRETCKDYWGYKEGDERIQQLIVGLMNDQAVWRCLSKKLGFTEISYSDFSKTFEVIWEKLENVNPMDSDLDRILREVRTIDTLAQARIYDIFLNYPRYSRTLEIYQQALDMLSSYDKQSLESRLDISVLFHHVVNRGVKRGVESYGKKEMDLRLNLVLEILNQVKGFDEQIRPKIIILINQMFIRINLEESELPYYIIKMLKLLLRFEKSQIYTR